MSPTDPLPESFKRGEGYFFMRNAWDSSGVTVISHPKAKVPAKGVPLFDDLVPNPFDDVPVRKQMRPPKKKTREVLSQTESNSSQSSLTSLELDTEGENDSSNPASSRVKQPLPGLKPLNVEPVSFHPYDHCHKIRLYNGKPDQYWYYYHVGTRIEAPPKVPHGSIIQEKALFVCDVVNYVAGKANCLERQVWINNGRKNVNWVIAQGANAVQQFDGRQYVFYISDEGPRWVQKKSLSKMKQNNSFRFT